MPIEPLVEIADNLWKVSAEVRLPGAGRMDGGMMVIRDGDSVWVCSPLALETGWADAVEALGRVEYLVAPNLYHHMFLPAAAKRFPDAIVVGPAGLTKKNREVALGAELDDEPLDGWPASIEIISIPGAPKLSERVFYHRPSRSLLVADLFFNITRPKGFMARLLLRFSGGWDKPVHSRLWRFLTKDKAAKRASIAALAELDIARIVPCHGNVIEDDVRAVLALAAGDTLE